MILPSFVFFTVFVRHWSFFRNSYLESSWKKMALIVALILFNAGTVRQCLTLSIWSLRRSRIVYRYFEGIPPRDLLLPIYECAVAPEVKTIDYRMYPGVRRNNLYNFEKFVTGLPLDEMIYWEQELLRKPYKQP
jgi:hypothetical protein